MLKRFVLIALLGVGGALVGSKIYVETGLRILDHKAYERPYPRNGCRRCSPESVDIPFYGPKGQELYLNVGSSPIFGNKLSVLTCNRGSAGYGPVETLGALHSIINGGGLPNSRWGTFCSGDA